MNGLEELNIPEYDRVLRVRVGPTIAFLALHRIFEGKAFGGIRLQRYAKEDEALRDALALAAAMSRKLAITDIPGGGAKTVVLVPKQLGRTGRIEALSQLGALIESLGGIYQCGGDSGFTAEDEEVLRQHTQHVADGPLAEYTARGVVSAIEIAAPDARRAVVQGLGAIGAPAARRLRAANIVVVAADPVGTGDFASIAPESVYDTECDVFVPCAKGGILNEETIPRLRCGVVCGGANNVLSSANDALALHRRGIVYVPDFLANAGATVVGASRARGESAAVDSRMAGLAATTSEVLRRAAAANCPPLNVALEIADNRMKLREQRERAR